MWIWLESARDTHPQQSIRKSEAKSWQTSDRMTGALADKHAAVSMNTHEDCELHIGPAETTVEESKHDH
jgi:hypothetical protein